jgi:hypothetical protein
MAEVLRADSAARKRVVLLIILGAFTGTVLIIGFEHYRTPLRNWLLSEPGELAHRVRLLFLLSSALLSAPLLAFAVYLWFIGAKVQRARQFPPPGFRVIRDTPVTGGEAAVARGRGFKVLALCLAMVSALLWLLLWRLAWLVSEAAADPDRQQDRPAKLLLQFTCRFASHRPTGARR